MRVDDNAAPAPRVVKTRKAAPPPAVSSIGLGGYINADLNAFEKSRMSPSVGGGKSVNLTRLAAEIAADQKKSKEHKSARKSAAKAATNSLHWIIDQLSRPENALTTALKNASDKNAKTSALGGVRSGWNLNERTNFAEVFAQPGLQSPFYHPGKKTRAAEGLIFDVAADPLNLVGTGIISKPLTAGAKGLRTLQEGREAGNLLRDAVKSRSAVVKPTDLLGHRQDIAGSVFLRPSEIAGQHPDDILGEAKQAADKIKKGKKSKAEKRVEEVLDQMEVSPKVAQGADNPLETLVQALRDEGVQAGKITPRDDNLSKLLPKTHVRIEPLRSIEHEGLLTPVVPLKDSVSKVAKGESAAPKGAVPLSEAHPDLQAKLHADTKRLADEMYDKRFGQQIGKVTQTKAGKNKFTSELDGMSMQDLRTLAAFETSEQAKKLFKVQDIVTVTLKNGRKVNVRDPFGGAVGQATAGAKSVKVGTGIEINTSATHLLKVIESSDEYRQIQRTAANRAILEHNKNIPKLRKNLPLIARSLEPIPKADEIVAHAVKPETQIDTSVLDELDSIESGTPYLKDLHEAESQLEAAKATGNSDDVAYFEDQVQKILKDNNRLSVAKSELARRSAVEGGGETKNLQAVVDKLEPIAPKSITEKLEQAASAQGTYTITPELEKVIDSKINSTIETITTGRVGTRKGHTYFSPQKQANLYNKIMAGLIDKMGYKKGLTRDFLTNDPTFRQFVREMYIRAENIMEMQHGFTPTEYKRGVIGNTGARTQRLSDFFAHVPIADEMAPTEGNFWTRIMTGEDGSGLAERIFAGTAIVEAPKTAHVIEEAADTAITAVDTLPEQKAMDVLDATPKAGKEAAKAQGLSESAQEVAKDNLELATKGIAQAKGELWALRYEQRDLRAAITDGSARLGLREAEAADRILGIGNIGNRSLIKINASAIRRNAGRLSPSMATALSDAATKARAAGERLTVRFNAGHGFDPFFHSMRRGVANSAAARSQQHMSEISKTFQGMNSEDLKNLLNDVQMGKLDSPQAQAAHDFLNSIFDPKEGWLTQNGITFQEFEEQLHRLYPTRVNSSGKAITDWRPQVVEKPVDKLKQMKPDATWHDSWKTWNWSDSPAADLLKVRLAFENSLAQRQMYEDLAHNFSIGYKDAAHAQARKDGWVGVKTQHPALKDRVFPPEIADQIDKHEEMFRMRKDSTNEFVKKYDKLLQAWKTGVTIYSPAHHIRNMVGDMWMAYFVDGVKNPIHYKQAMRAVLHERPDLNPAAFGEALTKTSDKDVLFHMKNGTPVTAEQWRIIWRDKGGHQAFASADNLSDLTSVKGRFPTMIRDKVASPIEDITRMGHAIALVKRSAHKDLVSAMEEVIPRVNRAHVDYGNLTDFERGVMRRLIPFYTWQRHVFPVLLDSMLRNPARIMAYPKIQVNIAEARGYERDDTNFFPQGHTLAPSWMTEGAGVPFYQNKRGNTVYGDPSNPFNDAIFKNLLLHPKESIGGMLSPAVRMPIEMFIKNDPTMAPEGRQFFGNIPIKNRWEYTEDNIPLLNQFIRLTRKDPVHGFDQRKPTQDRPDEQGLNLPNLINYLTAGGLQENTQRRQEFATKMEGARNG